jgi:predicted phage gp36 major capsid-like protein
MSFSTEGGNPLNWPTSDGTAEVGEIVAENGAATGADITFGTVAVNPYKYSSKKIALPWELISDSAIDVVGFVVNRLATRLGRITNTHYTTGDGSSEAVRRGARELGQATGTTGQTLTVIYDDLFDLKHSVNRAYRNEREVDDERRCRRDRLEDQGDDRPPDLGAGVTAGAPDMLLGHPVAINDDVAVMAANAKSILFGNFSSTSRSATSRAR